MPRNLTPEGRARIRKKHVLIVAGAVSCLYLANSAAILLSFPPPASLDPHAFFLGDQLAMRNTFHALLVLATSGLYVASRNRVWYITAWVYLTATSINAFACAATAFHAYTTTPITPEPTAEASPAQHLGILTLCLALLAEVCANAVLLATWWRFRRLSSPASGDDDSLPVTPPLGRGTLLHAAAYAAILAAFLLRNAEAILSAAAALTNTNTAAEAPLHSWASVAVEAIGLGGHTAVPCGLGLFYVIRALPGDVYLPESGLAYTLVVAGSLYADAISGTGDIPHGDTLQHSLLTYLNASSGPLQALSLGLVGALLLLQGAACHDRPGEGQADPAEPAPGAAGLPQEMGSTRRRNPLSQRGGFAPLEDSLDSALEVEGEPGEPGVAGAAEDPTRPTHPAGTSDGGDGSDREGVLGSDTHTPLAEFLSRDALRLLQALALLHVLAWYAECICLLVSAPFEAAGGAAVAAGVGGAHGAVLYGVQMLNLGQLSTEGRAVSGAERLRRHSFHTVTSLFYLATAGAAVAGCLRLLVFTPESRHAWQPYVLTACSVSRLLSAAFSISTLSRGGAWELRSSPPPCSSSPVGEGGWGATLSPRSASAAARMAVLQKGAAACVAAVVLLVCGVIASIGGGGSGGGGGGAHPPHVVSHSAGHALSFHFSFLYAIHALVGIFHYRVVSLWFILAGSPFIAVLVVVLCARQAAGGVGAPLVVLLPLAAAIAVAALLMLKIKRLSAAHPDLFRSGNVGWQPWTTLPQPGPPE